MKKLFLLFLSVLLAGSVLSGCKEGLVEQTNDSLSIYYPKISKETDSQSDQDYWNKEYHTYYKNVLNMFSWDYPDIKVTIYDPTNGDATMPRDQEEQIFNNDMMAGKGPDVLIGTTSMHTFKMMKGGAFCDLTPFIEADTEFKASYSEVILDGGKLDGKQYVLPISFTIPYLITMQETLDASGFDLDSCGNVQNYLREATHMMEQEDGMRIDGIPSALRPPWATWASDLIEYDTLALHLDTPDFRAFHELQKSVYHYDRQPGRGRLSERVMVWQKKALFIPSKGNYLDLGWVAEGLCQYSNPVVTVLKNSDSKLVGSIQTFAAIRANSPNQKLAYDFISTLANHHFQTDNFYDMPASSNARKANLIDVESVLNYFAGEKNEWYDDSGNLADTQFNLPYTPAIKDCMENAYALVDDVVKVTLTTDVLRVVSEFFEPYYEGESSYEDCLAKAQEQLTIYLSE